MMPQSNLIRLESRIHAIFNLMFKLRLK